MKLVAMKKISPEKLALAQKAVDSGITSVRGISTMSGICRNAVRKMLHGLGRQIETPNRPLTRAQVLGKIPVPKMPDEMEKLLEAGKATARRLAAEL